MFQPVERVALPLLDIFEFGLDAPAEVSRGEDVDRGLHAVAFECLVEEQAVDPIAPDKFKFDTSILVLVFVVLGGIGNIRGSVIAAALLTVLPEVLREFGDYRMLIYAIVLIAVMLLGNAPVVRQVLERIRPAKKEVVKEGDAA